MATVRVKMTDLNYELDFTERRPPAVQDAIADGMARAEDHADHFWKVAVSGCILAAARRLEHITVDDVLDELEKVNEARKALRQEPFETHNASAFGPAMKRASKDRVIVATNATKRSSREVKHGNRHTIWKSLVYEGTKQ